MSVTIKDIAREIGVSASTVSRILNDKSVQNKKLIQRVKDKAKELNYQVNTAAAGLRTNRTKLIGIVVPEISNDFFAEILSGVEEASEANGYNLLICQSNESEEKERKLIRSLISCNVEGILISSSIDDEDEEIGTEALSAGKKVVLFDRVPAGAKLPFVTIQDYDGSYKVTKHVLEQGRKKLLYHGMDRKLTNDKERLRGVKEALKENGIHEVDTFYNEDSVTFIDKVLEGKYDALVCYNDDLASQDMAQLGNSGVKIPGDLMVTGFDNRSICTLISPTLTTINHSTRDLGRRAFEMLFSMLESEESVENEVIPAELIIRESTST
ncbi:MAG: LacI family DNA-binding transcriptional regulator [Cyclobacteriaceae bacterium]